MQFEAETGHPPWSVPVTFFEMDLIAVDATGVLSLGTLLLALQMVSTRVEDTWKQLLPKLSLRPAAVQAGPFFFFLLPAASPSLPAPFEQHW